MKIVHFLGAKKPWQYSVNLETGQVILEHGVRADKGPGQFLQDWWNVYHEVAHRVTVRKKTFDKIEHLNLFGTCILFVMLKLKFSLVPLFQPKLVFISLIKNNYLLSKAENLEHFFLIPVIEKLNTHDNQSEVALHIKYFCYSHHFLLK